MLRTPWRRILSSVSLLTALLVAAGYSNQAASAAAHPSLVPEVPEGGYPVILDTPRFPLAEPPDIPNAITTQGRQTMAVDQIGDYIVSGGDFVNVELQNGRVVTQPNLAVFDVRTKQLVCTNLDVNGTVLAITPGPNANTAYVAGEFTQATGADGKVRPRNKVALINLATCSVNKTFVVNGLDGKVTEVVAQGDRLFIGGNFNAIAGSRIGRLAEVDASTGALNPNFSFAFGGAVGRTVVGMDTNASGSRLGIVHRATTIDGAPVRGTAIFDITNPNAPRLTAHRMSQDTAAWDWPDKIQNGAFAPDFSGVAVVSAFENEADFVYYIPTTERANQLQWGKYMRDSTLGVAITNQAVYVSGHFCLIDSGPRASKKLAPNSGPAECSGTRREGRKNPRTNEPNPDGVFRTQLAALAISDGTPLDWNPGNDAIRGGTALTAVDGGLLSGYDGMRTNNIRVGTTAFFAFDGGGGGQTVSCTATESNGLVSLSWNRIAGVTDYVVRRNDSWVASPGNAVAFDDAPPAGTHRYVIRTRSGGVISDARCSPDVTVAATGQTCTSTRNGSTVTLRWSAIAGESLYQVRKNGKWLASARNVLTFSTTGNAGDEFAIRSRQNGTTTTTPCR